MATYTWDAIYDRLKVDQGGLPNKSTQDMLDTFWTLAGYPDGTLGADAKVAFYESQGAIGDSLGDLEYDYWYRVGPNILAAKGAVFAIDAAQSISGEQWVLNRGSGGQVLRARYGSVGRAEIRNGVGFVAPSNSGNTPSVPDAANLRISGTLEMLGRFEGNTRPATTGYLAIKSSDGTYVNRWYSAILYNSGQLGLWCRDTAMNSVDKGSVSAIPSTTTAFWWKVNVNPATGVFNFYYAPDQIDEPTSWTDLGGTTGSFVGNAILTGSGGDVRGHHLVDGVQKRLMIRNAIGSGTVLDIDFTAQTDLVSSFVASTGQTVTVTAANAVDTNDPLWLPWNGENYVYFPGTTGNIITTAWSAAAFTTCSWRMKVRLDSLPGSVVAIAGADSTYGTVQIDTVGRIVCGHRDAATNLIGAQWSSVPVPGLIGGDVWLRADLDATTATCTYYVSSDSTNDETAVTWTQVGTPVVGAFAGNTPDPTANILSGSNSVGLAGFPARFYAMSFYTNGVCRTAWRMVGQDPTLTTGTSLTINRATSGRKTAVVTRPIWLFGTDDYLEVADNDLLDFAANESYTLVVVARVFGTYINNAYAAKKASNGVAAGYALHYESGGATLFHSPSDGTLYPFVGTARPASGALAAVVAVRDVSADQNIVYVNGATASVTDTTTATLANAQPFRVSGWDGGGGPLDMEVLAVGIFRRALSATEIAQIVTYYGAS